jgi:nicotinate-nucleotide pyrophosphorylase (carboxylating)
MDKELLQAIDELINRGLHEDVNTGDITTICLSPRESKTTAVMIAKADGIIAGLQVAEAVFRKLDKDVNLFRQ